MVNIQIVALDYGAVKWNPGSKPVVKWCSGPIGPCLYIKTVSPSIIKNKRPEPAKGPGLYLKMP